MTTRLQELLGLATIVILVTCGFAVSGCGTYASWTPKTGTSVEAYHERSCASGYYQCTNGSRGGTGNTHGGEE